MFLCLGILPDFAVCLPDWQAVKKRRRKENGNFISSSTAFWTWRACLKREWSLLSCLNRWDCIYLEKVKLQISWVCDILLLTTYDDWFVHCTLFTPSFFLCQAHESLISGHFPASEETLQHLAALRLQYLHGDGAGRAGWSLGSVYPMGRLRNRILHSTKPGVGAAGGAAGGGGGGAGDGKGMVGGPGGIGTAIEKRKTPSFLDGTLRRSFKTGSLKKQKVG